MDEGGCNIINNNEIVDDDNKDENITNNIEIPTKFSNTNTLLLKYSNTVKDTNDLKCIAKDDIMGQNDAPDMQLELLSTTDREKENENPNEVNNVEEENRDNADFCRICHDADTEEILITPCRCKGTLSMVHRSCLEKWLAASDSSNCELCGQFYVTLRTPKYRYLPSIINWLRSEDSCRDVRELVLDLMALCVFTPMALLGTYLGLFAAENFYLTELDPARRDVTSARLVTLIVMSLMATIDLAYVSWLTVRTQYHIQQWHGWWRRQCTVKLFLPEEAVPHQTD